MLRTTSKRPWDEVKENLSNELGYSYIWKRLAMIEDVLGDDYNLERLKELVEADKEGKCLILTEEQKMFAIKMTKRRMFGGMRNV